MLQMCPWGEGHGTAYVFPRCTEISGGSPVHREACWVTSVVGTPHHIPSSLPALHLQRWSGGSRGTVCREGRGWGTNDCSRMASEEKQIFVLDLRHIPGIQRTCPAAESPSSPNQPLSLKRKTPARGPPKPLVRSVWKSPF